MVKHTLALPAIALMFSLAAVWPAAAQEVFRESGPAIIGGKAPNALILEIHGLERFVDRFMMVSAITRIYDENGERITLADLNIPCQARIEYRIAPGHDMAEAVSVHVVHYWENRPASAGWTAPAVGPVTPH